MDDQDLLRELVGRILASMGYEADCAASGEEALQVCRKAIADGRPFKVVILDLTVPGGMDGIETLAGLREMDPDVKAIVSSGCSEAVNKASFLQYGFDAFMSKPYDADKLARVLRDVLEHETGNTP
jgi:CheY-like chemotaxis protein